MSQKEPLRIAREIIALAITDEEWVDAFKEMHTIIKTSDDPMAKVSALRLLCDYAFGKPAALVPDDDEQEWDDDEPLYEFRYDEPKDNGSIRQDLDAA